MSAQAQVIPNEFHSSGKDSSWKGFCQLAGSSALILLIYPGDHGTDGNLWRAAQNCPGRVRHAASQPPGWLFAVGWANHSGHANVLPALFQPLQRPQKNE